MVFVFCVTLQDYMIKDTTWFHGFEILKISHNPTTFGGYRHYSSGDKHGFNLPHDFTRLRDKTITWLYEKKPNKASYHHAKFGGYSYSGSGAIIVTWSNGHVVLWVGALMVRNYSSTFGGDRHFGSRDMVLLVIKGQDFSCRCLNSLLLTVCSCHVRVSEWNYTL